MVKLALVELAAAALGVVAAVLLAAWTRVTAGQLALKGVGS